MSSIFRNFKTKPCNWRNAAIEKSRNKREDCEMAYVFKKKNPHTGRNYPEWRFRYKDVSGKWIQGVGWPDKQKTLDHARSVEAERRAIRKGEKEAPPAFLQNRNKPIGEVVSEYLAWGNAQGGRGGRPWAKMLADNRRRFLAKWIDELHLTSLADIDVVKVEQRARETLKNRSAKTVAGHVEALTAMCYWAVKRNYLARNPLQSMSRFDIRPTCPHRAMTPEEVLKLLAVTPPHRQLWYRTALATGYRLSECASLTVRSLDLFGPSLPLAADFTKNRKDARQPIDRELADELAAYCKHKTPDDSLLDMPKKNTTSDHLSNDFDAAKICRKTSDGKATFHSFRVNYINAVIESGADLKTVMELARHGSAAMSMEVYAKAKPERVRAAADAAHKYMRQQMDSAACGTGVAQQKTGTDDVVVSDDEEGGCVVSEVISGLGFEPR
ncbi:MAG: tyrosine-type recombinase/integrase, partial [Planctomycetota bacterium]